MKIDEKLVRHVAALARLELTDEEIARYRKQLARVFGHIEQLSEVDIDGIRALSSAGDFTNVFRKDEERSCLSQEEALRNAPEQKDGFFIVPRVIEE